VVTIRPCRDDAELARANATYRAIRFAETPAGAVALVAEERGVIVGLGRLVELEPGVVEMGGIWTDEAMRGRGVARQMVTELLARASAPRLWCLPFAHLTAFYESFGFAHAPAPWPAAVAAKMRSIEALALPAAVVLVRRQRDA
jgi:N-acetylglutamate synthase-like GNAT family acetyltransferase